MMETYLEPKPEVPKFFCVAIGLEDRAYGGPEEGGWWYDTFEPLDEYAHMTKIVITAEEAYRHRDELRQWIVSEKLNEGRRPTSSVLSEGQYDVHVYRGRYPHYVPERRPHYE